jgi:hypothetical protein
MRRFLPVLLAGTLALSACAKLDSPPGRATSPGDSPAPQAAQDEQRAREADSAAFKALKEMKFDIRDYLIGKAYGYLIQLAEKEVLNEDGTIKPEILRHVKQLSKPVQLSVFEVPLSDAGLAQVKEMPSVVGIMLRKTQRVTEAGVRNLAGAPRLTSLTLVELKLGDGALPALAECKRLKSVNLFKIPVNDRALQAVRKLTDLEALEIDPADNLSAAGLALLKGLPKVERLVLHAYGERTRLDDAALKEIGGLRSLKKLMLGPELPISLSPRARWVRDTGLVHLAGLKGLKELDLGCCANMTDTGLGHLKGLSNLERLNIGFTKVTDAGLAHIKGLTNLKELTLNGLPLTEKGLAQLRGLSSLQWLDLRETGAGVTDQAILQLKGLSKLRDLIVYDTAVTKEGAAQLKKALPDVSIGAR